MAKVMTTAASLTAIAAMVSPLPAYSAQLVRWRFDPQTRQLEIVTPGGTQPNYFILAQPPRIVVDLPDTTVGSVLAEQTYSGSVRQIRVNQFQPTLTRLVIELEPNVELAAQQVELRSLDPQNGRWAIRPLLEGDMPALAQQTATVGGWANDGANVAIAQTEVQDLQSGAALGQNVPEDEDSPGNLEPGLSEPASEPRSTGGDIATAPESFPSLEPGALEIAVDLEVIPAEAAAPEDERPTAENNERAVEGSEDVIEPNGLSVAPSEPTPLSSVPAEEVASVESGNEEPLGEEPSSLEAASLGAASLGSPNLEAASLDILNSVVPPEQPSALPTEPGRSVSARRDAPQVEAEAFPTEAIAPSPIRPVVPEAEPVAEAAEAEPIQVEPVESESVEAEPIGSEPIETPQVELVGSEPAEVGLEASQSEPAEPAAGAVEVSRIEPVDGPQSDPVTEPISRQPPAPLESRLDSEIALRVDTPSSILIPAGTVLRLRYPRSSALELAAGESRQEILLTTQVVQDQRGEIVLPAGTQIIGRFESEAGEGRFVAQAVVSVDGNRPLSGISAVDLNRRRLAVEPNQTLELQLGEDLLKE